MFYFQIATQLTSAPQQSNKKEVCVSGDLAVGALINKKQVVLTIF